MNIMNSVVVMMMLLLVMVLVGSASSLSVATNVPTCTASEAVEGGKYLFERPSYPALSQPQLSLYNAALSCRFKTWVPDRALTPNVADISSSLYDFVMWKPNSVILMSVPLGYCSGVLTSNGTLQVTLLIPATTSYWMGGLAYNPTTNRIVYVNSSGVSIGTSTLWTAFPNGAGAQQLAVTFPVRNALGITALSIDAASQKLYFSMAYYYSQFLFQIASIDVSASASTTKPVVPDIVFSTTPCYQCATLQNGMLSLNAGVLYASVSTSMRNNGPCCQGYTYTYVYQCTLATANCSLLVQDNAYSPSSITANPTAVYRGGVVGHDQRLMLLGSPTFAANAKVPGEPSNPSGVAGLCLAATNTQLLSSQYRRIAYSDVYWLYSSIELATSDACPVGCGPQGECTEPAVCTCLAGWVGSACQCGTYQCSLQGSCLVAGSQDVFKCSCDVNSYGEQCQTYCLASDTCSGHGSCNNSTGACDCSAGFAGPSCSTQVATSLSEFSEFSVQYVVGDVAVTWFNSVSQQCMLFEFSHPKAQLYYLLDQAVVYLVDASGSCSKTFSFDSVLPFPSFSSPQSFLGLVNCALYDPTTSIGASCQNWTASSIGFLPPATPALPSSTSTPPSPFNGFYVAEDSSSLPPQTPLFLSESQVSFSFSSFSPTAPSSSTFIPPSQCLK